MFHYDSVLEKVSGISSFSLLSVAKFIEDDWDEKIPTINKNISLSSDGLLYDDHTLKPEALISVNGCAQVEDDMPLQCDT